MILGMFIGGTIVFIIMVAIINNRMNEAIETVKQCENTLEHERVAAIKEKKSTEYINGMNKIITLFKFYFKEELEQ